MSNTGNESQPTTPPDPTARNTPPPEPDRIILVPLSDINPDALPRDRSHQSPETIEELRQSILRSGLRLPVEVLAYTHPEAPFRYGLISGARRYSVFRALAEDWGHARFAAIPAIVRKVGTEAEALSAMIEENDLRDDISPWDQARIAVDAAAGGVFATVDAAIDQLYRSSDRQRRARIRAMSEAVVTFGGLFRTPHLLTQRQLLRLATAARAGFTDLIVAALGELTLPDLPRQMAHIENVLTEAEAELRDPSPRDPRPGYPRRLATLRPGVMIRRERRPRGWSLHFTGPDAKGMLMDDIMDQIERDYGR